MNMLPNANIAFINHSDLTAALLDTSLKSFFIMALIAGLCLLCRRSSAATRHWLWLAAVAGCLFSPLLSLVIPAWQEPLLAVSTRMSPGNQVTLSIERPGSANPLPVPPMAPSLGSASVTPEPNSPPPSRQFVTRFSAGWLFAAPLIWLLGTGAALGSIIAGLFRLRTLKRNAHAPRDLDWMPLFAEVCRQAKVSRPVTLLQSDTKVMPLTWGWWNPVVLLPADAARWPAERRRLVLLHELAHIRRWDCLTQTVAAVACAVYWFNPLVWLASRRMSVERERACDDRVLDADCRASDYAGHLLEIARTFRRVPGVAGIAMARPQQLGSRIEAILDGTRARGAHPGVALILCCVVAGFVVCLGGCKTGASQQARRQAEALRQEQIARLKIFAAEKEKQSRDYAAQDGEVYFPDFASFFDAAVKGDGRTVLRMYEDFKRRHGQYENATDDVPHTSYWSPVLEVALGYYEVMSGEPKYEQLAIDGIIESIPPGSIYFGGTDPGRGLPTAFSKSHINADPFYTLTQNALADGTYLDYLRRTYGKKIYTPTEQDSKNCFKDYLADAERRLREDKLKPGEDVRIVEQKVQVSGQVAVMTINGALARIVFDKNPTHQFYVEESFPLDWMYPHLSPNGLIMKLNREPLAALPDDTLKADHEYWGDLAGEMIGDWLTQDTPVQTVCEFVEKVYARNDLREFDGDRRYVQNRHPQRLFSKLRSSIAGVYAWRVANAAAGNDAEKQRMAKEADFAFRQAFAICPTSPEAIFRYVNFLNQVNRPADGLRIVEAALEVEPENKQVQNLAKELGL